VLDRARHRAVSFAAPAITVVGLKSIAADLVLAVPCDRETHGGDIHVRQFRE